MTIAEFYNREMENEDIVDAQGKRVRYGDLVRLPDYSDERAIIVGFEGTDLDFRPRITVRWAWD